MRLKEYRKKKGLTTYEVGKALGVSPSAVTNWETGLRRPDIDTLIRLSEILDCTPNDLLGIDREKEKTVDGRGGGTECRAQ